MVGSEWEVDTCKTKNLKLLKKADWAVYSGLRLGSLEESPDSFSSLFEGEAAFGDGE